MSAKLVTICHCEARLVEAYRRYCVRKAHVERSETKHMSYRTTAGSDGSVKLWPIQSSDELIKQACNWVQDYLQNNPNVSKT